MCGKPTLDRDLAVEGEERGRQLKERDRLTRSQKRLEHVPMLTGRSWQRGEWSLGGDARAGNEDGRCWWEPVAVRKKQPLPVTEERSDDGPDGHRLVTGAPVIRDFKMQR